MDPLLSLYLGRTATTGTSSLTLNSPSNSGSVGSTTPTLEFTGVSSTGDQNISYELQLDTSSAFTGGSTNPAIDSTLVGTGSITSGSSNTITMTGFSTGGANRLVLVWINQSSSSAGITSVTASGLTFSLIGSGQSDGASQGLTYLYAAWAASTQTSTVVTVNLSGAQDPAANAVTQCFSGTISGAVSVANCFGNKNQNLFASGTNPSLTVTTTANNSLVVAGVGASGSSTVTAGTGQTKDTTKTSSSISQIVDLRQTAVTSTSGTVVTMNCTMGTSVDTGFIAVEILAFIAPLIDAFSVSGGHDAAQFADITNGGDSDPFPSGDEIGFTVPGGEALTVSVTYYWRVRANVLGNASVPFGWSSTYSFTVSSGTSASVSQVAATLTATGGTQVVTPVAYTYANAAVTPGANTFSVVQSNNTNLTGQSSTANWNITATFVNAPVAGDLLVIQLSSQLWILANLLTTTIPSGWTQDYKNVAVGFLHKVATGSEGANYQVTIQINGASGYTNAYLTNYEISGFTGTITQAALAYFNDVGASVATTGALSYTPTNLTSSPMLLISQAILTGTPGGTGISQVLSPTNLSLTSQNVSSTGFWSSFVNEIDAPATAPTITYNWTTNRNPTSSLSMVFWNTGTTLTIAGGTQTVATIQIASIAQVAGTITATGGTQSVVAVQNATVAQSAATLTTTGGTQVVTTINDGVVAQAAATLTVTTGTQAVAAVVIASASISQLAAAVTAAGGTQVITTVNDSSISQSAAVLTASGGTQSVSAVAIVTASISQSGATLTIAGGTQVITTIRDVSISQIGANITASGGTQVVATINDSSISQSAATITAAGGTQGIQDLQDVAIAQLAATLTASGGTQSVSSVNIVSLSQSHATLTATGGTQTVATINVVALSQAAATITASGSTQTVFTTQSATISQVGANITAGGGTQLVKTNGLIPQSAASLTVTGGTQSVATINIVSISQVGVSVTASGGSQGIQDIQDISLSQLAANLTAAGGTQTIASIQDGSISQSGATLTASGGTQAVSAAALVNVTVSQVGATLTLGSGTGGSASIIQYVEMSRNIYNAGGTTYTTVGQVMTELDTSQFDGTVNFYFEVDLYNAGAGTAYAQLYDLTDSTAISGSELTLATTSTDLVRLRSSALSLSGAKTYTVQIKNTINSSDTYIVGARIVVTQSGTITQTQIHQELGLEGSSQTVSPYIQHHTSQFLYTASAYDGTVAIRYEASVVATSGNTSYAGLYDLSASAVVSGSTVSTTSTTRSIVQSGAITLIDGHVYQPIAYVSGGATYITESAKIVFTITGGFTKYLAYINSWFDDTGLFAGYTQTTTAYNITTVSSSTNITADGRLGFNASSFSGATVAYYHEANIMTSNALGTAYAALFAVDPSDNPTEVTGSEVTTSSTTLGRVRSGALTLPVGAFDTGIGLHSSSASYTATVSAGAYIVAQVSGLGTGGQSVATVNIATVTQSAATLTAAGGSQTITTGSIVNGSVTQLAATLTAAGGTQTVATVNVTAITQVHATLTTSGGTQVVTSVNIVAISQVAATITASGGAQSVQDINDVAISQVAAVLTVAGGTQVIVTLRSVSVAQVAANLTLTGGTQLVQTTGIIAQAAATLTTTGGTQVVATIRIVAISQVGATLTTTGGAQGIQDIQDAALAQIGAALTIAGGTQVVSSARIAAVSQSGAALTVTGGTQALAIVRTGIVSQLAANLAISGGTQVVAIIRMGSVFQAAATITTTGGAQLVAAYSVVTIVSRAASLTATSTVTQLTSNNTTTALTHEYQEVRLTSQVTESALSDDSTRGTLS